MRLSWVMMIKMNGNIVQLDGRFFFLNPKKMIFFLAILQSLKRFNGSIIKRRRIDIAWTKITLFIFLLHNKIVSGGNMIMFIGLNTSLGILQIKIKLLQLQ